MTVAMLLYLLAFGGGLAVLHVVLSAACRRFPLVLFVALGSLTSTTAGLLVIGRVLLEQSRQSTPTMVWWLGYGLGFFAVGFVVSISWVALVGGLHSLIRRLVTGGRAATDSSDPSRHAE